MRLKKDKKGEKHLEIRLSQETGVVLTEALTLLHQVSQEASCQRCLVRTKWFAVLLDLSIFSPTHCRQKALMLLSDLLPLATIEVSVCSVEYNNNNNNDDDDDDDDDDNNSNNFDYYHYYYYYCYEHFFNLNISLVKRI